MYPFIIQIKSSYRRVRRRLRSSTFSSHTYIFIWQRIYIIIYVLSSEHICTIIIYMLSNEQPVSCSRRFQYIPHPRYILVIPPNTNHQMPSWNAKRYDLFTENASEGKRSCHRLRSQSSVPPFNIITERCPLAPSWISCMSYTISANGTLSPQSNEEHDGSKQRGFLSHFREHRHHIFEKATWANICYADTRVCNVCLTISAMSAMCAISARS